MSWDQLVQKQADKLAKPEMTHILFAVSNPKKFEAVLPAVRLRAKVSVIDQGWAAVEHGVQEKYDAAVIEADMPGITGFEIVKRIHEERKEKDLSSLPTLFIGNTEQVAESLDLIREFCENSMSAPFHPSHFLSQLWEVCDVAAEGHWLELNPLQQSVLKVTKSSIRKMFDAENTSTIIKPELYEDCSRVLVEAAANRDLRNVVDMLKRHHGYTFVHVLKVSSLMTIFGAELGLGKTDMELLAQGGLMHDVGKRDTPIEILEKPSQLDPQEWEEMRKHVTLSGSILRASPGIPQEVINIAERHHEKIDGSGYPYGLKGGQMDDLSLISAIMDIYSALTDKRSYKQAMVPQKALSIMDNMVGDHIEEGFYYRFKEMVLDGCMGDV
ncbi:HD domain-containing phosphohydrolase [Curvivirga sp.]|uniref:HD domain-containing protein n=1 Tax=Curvivirga sp. TaxID=2856848 RepID=UPI003B5B6187